MIDKLLVIHENEMTVQMAMVVLDLFKLDKGEDYMPNIEKRVKVSKPTLERMGRAGLWVKHKSMPPAYIVGSSRPWTAGVKLTAAGKKVAQQLLGA
jgi:hypothetical protein